uniref:Regulatory protein zeste n=1 Tax=Cacopsylla melanoneura TaxID=428564 RepID=A0A8D9BXA2_9HEMI
MSQGVPRRRQQGRTFSEEETVDLLRLIDENILSIERKFRDEGPVQDGMKVWREISMNLAALGHVRREPHTIKAKWNQMKCAARKEISDVRKDQYGTGGGPGRGTRISITTER